MAVDEATIEAPEDEVQSEAEPEAFVCEVCERVWPSARSLARHRRVHGQKTGAAPAAPPRRGRKAGRTEQGLTLAYGLAAMAFGAFGPAPVEARQRTAMAAQLTAARTGAALDRGLRKTPFYPLVAAVFGIGAIFDDLAPAALPLVVGVYNYAPPGAQARIRPMTRVLAGQILHQTFGDTPPELTEVTPVAIPAWIRELTDQLFPEPPTEATLHASSSGSGPQPG